MAIRYFATNRNIELVGVDRDRTNRVKLQKSGYYFVDMSRYMAYYLGEIETDKIPHSAIVTNSRSDIFDKLKSPAVEKIVVCVHGFNVNLHEAYTWFRILTDTMKSSEEFGPRIVTDPHDIPESREIGNLVAFIGFSWPSNGSVFRYHADQSEARGSAMALGNLLARLHRLGNKSINLICHSMGNYLACHMLAALLENQTPYPFAAHVIKDEEPNLSESDANELHEKYVELLKRGDLETDEVTLAETSDKQDRFIDRYIMLAPDIERRHVVKSQWKKKRNGSDAEYVGPFFSGLQHLVGEVYNVYSRFDLVLTASDLEKSARDKLRIVPDLLDKLSLGMIDYLNRNPDDKWEKRLGEVPHPPNSPGNFFSINATELTSRKIGHSDHIDSAPIAEKIADILHRR